MKNKLALAAVAALCMGLSGVTLAQQDKDVRADEAGRMSRQGLDPNGRRLNRPVQQRQPEHDRGGDRNRDRGHDHDGPGWDRNHGVGPDHNVYRGGRLPSYYRSNQYVVDDWRGHHLRQPPRGYHWVQTGAEYALVAIATGVIADILLNQ
jgi:Ni/Co efflux regulator RcnB